MIGRLAEAYEAIAPTIGQATELSVKIVSNQPLDPELHEKFVQLREATDTLDLAGTAERLREDSTLADLQEAGGLQWLAFVAFLRALDLRELGAASLVSAETNLFIGLDQFTS